MNLNRVRPVVLCFGSLALAASLFAQTAPAPASQPAQDTATQPSAKPKGPAAAPEYGKPGVPDYPDKRTITVGANLWATVTGSGPDLLTGSQANDYETLKGLGKPKFDSFSIYIAVPITRTGELKVEGFRNLGDGNQTAPQDMSVFSTDFNKGNQFATSYNTLGFKFYLDDLFWPHKFPVAKFRLKTLWGMEFARVATSATANVTDSVGNVTSTNASGNLQMVLPAFGMAAEYQMAPHALFRVEGMGFDIPRHSNVGDVNGYISVRHSAWELRGGYRFLHFRSKPNNTEYISDTVSGAYIGAYFHWM